MYLLSSRLLPLAVLKQCADYDLFDVTRNEIREPNFTVYGFETLRNIKKTSFRLTKRLQILLLPFTGFEQKNPSFKLSGGFCVAREIYSAVIILVPSLSAASVRFLESLASVIMPLILSSVAKL